MSKNYYDILGINKNASENDIKKAFKKLSLKYHPDRHANDSEDEKAKAEEQFKEINEAYSVLSDSEKKKYYDTFGSLDGYGQGGGPNINPNDIFEKFRRNSGFGFNPFGDGFGRHEYMPENGTNIKMEVPFTIEEFYLGTTKTLKYKKKFRCPICHGAGGSGEEECPECNGTGFTEKVFRNGFNQTIIRNVCSRCNGKGRIYKYECDRCHGTGFDEKDTSVTVDFPAGIQPMTGVVVEGGGNESADIRGNDGSFIAIVNLTYDTTRYQVSGYDIKEFVKIPYYDALLGCTVKIVLPDKKEKIITVAECTPDGKTYRLTNCGLKVNGIEAGDYLVQIKYTYPTKLSNEEKEHLKEIKDKAKNKK